MSIRNRLEMRADFYLCGGHVQVAIARVLYLVLNLSDGYGVRKSLSEFLDPPYGA